MVFGPSTTTSPSSFSSSFSLEYHCLLCRKKKQFFEIFTLIFSIHLHQARSSCFYIDREHKPLLLKVNREFVVTTNRNLCSNQEFGDRGWTTLFLEDFQLYGLVRENVDVLLRYDYSTLTSQELE